MGRSELVMAAAPSDVWQILAEPEHYAHWVVGSSEIRDWDDNWPARGSRFYHRVGAKPLTIADNTEVLESRKPRRLVLRAKTRPLGVARVELQLQPHPAGTLVTMIEDPDIPLGGLLTPPPLHALIRLRNGESLRRLRSLAEARAATSASRAPRRPRSSRSRTRHGAQAR